MIAGAASAAAAIVVSHIWKGGTVIAAAMTPVIVAIVKELLAKPMESELVKKPVAKIASGSRAVVGTAAGGRIGRSQPEQRGQGDPLMDGDSLEPPTQPRGAQTDPGMSPIRTYGGSQRRRPRIHLKVALITGLVAFALAAAALTLPELIFGGAISSPHSTTLFGGGGSSKRDGHGQDQQHQHPAQPAADDASADHAAADDPSADDAPADHAAADHPSRPARSRLTPAPTTPAAPAPPGPKP